MSEVSVIGRQPASHDHNTEPPKLRSCAPGPWRCDVSHGKGTELSIWTTILHVQSKQGTDMTVRRWLRYSVALGAGLAIVPMAEAQIRPQPRPANLMIAAPEEAVVPAATNTVPALSPPEVGPVTNLPLPRFVSLKTDEGNARRGPSLDQRIDWVFVREDMPLQITAEYDNWRRVEDREGLGGWIHYSLLSGTRTVIVDEGQLPLRTRPQDNATEIALLEQNVIARLETCEADWCRIIAGGYGGWVRKTALWGVGPDEVFD